MPQLPPIGEWARRPASAATSARGAHVVLLIRGELLHRYPDALIYAVKAKTLKALGTEEKLPLFRGRIDPDITFLGFDLTEAQARGTTATPAGSSSIQEQPTAPRFGMDETRTGAARHVERPRLERRRRPRPARTSPSGSRSPTVASPGGVAWGFNGAHMAAVLRQRPVRIAIHARRLLAGEPPVAPPPPPPRRRAARRPTADRGVR